MSLKTKVIVLCLSFVCLSYLASDQKTEWAKNNAKAFDTVMPENGLADMDSAFNSVIGDARIVALGESGHAIREVALFRTRLLEYLVKRKGFRAIALESGLFEGQLANRYIYGLEDNINNVLRNGFTHNMGPWEETKVLLEWMRQYNLSQSDPRQQIYFYGMDLPLFQDSIMNRTPQIDSPLEQVLEVIKRTDIEYYNTSGLQLVYLATLANKTVDDVADFFEKLKGVRYIDPDFLDEICSISYENLTKEQKHQLSYLLDDLISTMEARRVRYLNQGNITKEEFEFALQLAKMSSRIIGNLTFRKRVPAFPNIEKLKVFLGTHIYPNGKELEKLGVNKINFHNTPEEWRRYFEGRNGRERTMMANVEWIAERHRKVLIYAHNGHISKHGYLPPSPEHDGSLGFDLGNFLASKYKKDYIAICQTMDQFVDKDGNIIDKYHGAPITKTDDRPEAIEKVLKQVKNDLFVIDFRKASPSVKRWLNQKLDGRYVVDFLKVNHYKTFDAIVFIRNMQFGIKVK